MKQKRRAGAKILAALLVLAVVALAALWVVKQVKSLSPEKTATMENGWNLILINPEYRLPEDYLTELTELSNGERVDERIYPDLQRMFDDMRAEGLSPEVNSGYRTAELQQTLLDREIEDYLDEGYSKKEAETQAKLWVAEPGHSEHQTGLAVDVSMTDGDADGVYGWLAENAYRYGFICRYQEDKTDLTGINPEPWHYRYVGAEAAEIIYEQNLCLEEYIAQYCE